MSAKQKLSGGRTDRETFDRAVQLAQMLFRGEVVTAKAIMDRFDVALSTAHRDLVALECLLPVAVEEVHQKPWPNPRKVMRMMSARAAA